MNEQEINQLFLQLLNDRFAKKKETNSHYSLRAFARDLGISPSLLSLLLSSKTTITHQTAKRIVHRLSDDKNLINQVLESLKSFSSTRNLKHQIKKVKNIKVEKNSHGVVGWHFAVLNAYLGLNKISKIEKINQDLGFSSLQTNYIIDQLEKERIVRRIDAENIENLIQHIYIESDKDTRRERHAPALSKINELMDCPGGLMAYYIVNLNKENAENFKDEISAFIEKVSLKYSSQSIASTELMQFSLQLIPLVQNKLLT